jgi:hypothetical protein
MIHHLTECKTDKTVIHKIEWNNEECPTFNKPISLVKKYAQK